MNLLFWRKKQSDCDNGKVNPPKIEITEPSSCIAQCILNDLAPENEKNWKQKYYLYGYEFIGKRYTIFISHPFYLSVFLKGADSYEFPSDEKELISAAIDKIISIKNEKQKKKDNKKLAQLFPQCFDQELRKDKL